MESPSPELARATGGALERGLPLVPAPFAAAARALGAREAEVLEAARALRSGGFLRHIGAFVDFRPLGLSGYLFGLQDAGAFVAARLAELESVTHIYERRAPLGLWFTAILPGDEAALELSASLDAPHAALAAVRRIKLEPAFARGGEASDRGLRPHPQGGNAPLTPFFSSLPFRPLRSIALCGNAPLTPLFSSSPFRPLRSIGLCGEAPLTPLLKSLELSSEQRGILRLAQREFTLESRPFARIGARAGVSEEGVLACLRELSSLGVLRRIGASLHHVRAGYASNSLIAWDFAGAPEAEALDAAARIAGHDWLSHCYLRRVLVSTLAFDWRYTLFAMIHARSDDELREREMALAPALPGCPSVSMRTEREWKKTLYMIA